MAQPPGKRFDVTTYMEANGFMQQIQERFAANSAIRKEFLGLLAGYRNGRITDPAAVVARAKELLQGNPDLVGRLQAFLDPEQQAMGFLERVKLAGKEVYDEFIAFLLHVDEERGLDAHEIYAQFKQVLGSANEDLLPGFVRFLPTKHDLPPCAAEAAEQADRRSTRKRRHDPVPDDVGAAKRSSRSRAKKTVGMDDGHAPTQHPAASCDAGADSCKLSRAKKPRVHDDSEPKYNPNPISCSGAGPSTMEPTTRADDGGKKNRCAPLYGTENSTARGAAPPVVSPFRKAWEFETGYAKLAATIARADELRSRGQRGASLEELFPSRECREFLAEMYQEAWRTMRKMLENDAYIGFALEVVLRSLRAKEEAAVEAARNWQDPTRAGQRLNDLVRDKVVAEMQRHGASGTSSRVAAITS